MKKKYMIVAGTQIFENFLLRRNLLFKKIYYIIRCILIYRYNGY